jgi:hypothetical protein
MHFNASEKCPNCQKIFPTIKKPQISTWSFHKKTCKPKNTITFNNNINPPPPPLNINEERKFPNSKKIFKYSTQYYINFYNQHIKRYRPRSSTINIQ